MLKRKKEPFFFQMLPQNARKTDSGRTDKTWKGVTADYTPIPRRDISSLLPCTWEQTLARSEHPGNESDEWGRRTTQSHTDLGSTWGHENNMDSPSPGLSSGNGNPPPLITGPPRTCNETVPATHQAPGLALDQMLSWSPLPCFPCCI